MTVTPAYGRDYKTAKAAKADWQANKDFIISDHFHPDDGRYVNREQMNGKPVMIRFGRLMKTCQAK